MATELNFLYFEEQVPRRMSKDNVVYLKSDGRTQCRTCHYFLPALEKCTVVDGEIKPNGTCDLIVHGQNATPENDNRWKVMREEAGYLEREEGFSCGNCFRFISSANKCHIVEGDIRPQDCCNLWDDDGFLRTSY